VTFAKRLLCPLALTLSFVTTSTSIAQAPATVSLMDATKLHQKLSARGIGKGVKVTETDGTTISGILVVIDTDSFQITPKKATQPTLIQNTQVVKLSNTGMSTGAKVGTGVVIGLVAAAAAFAITLAVLLNKI